MTQATSSLTPPITTKLSKRIRNRLTKEFGEGWTLDSIADVTEVEFLRMPDLGIHSVNCIAEELAANGFNTAFVQGMLEHKAYRLHQASMVKQNDGRKWTSARRAARMKLRALKLSPQMGASTGYNQLKTIQRVFLGYANIDGHLMCRVRRNGVVDAVSVGSLSRRELNAYIELAEIKGKQADMQQFRIEWLAAIKDART